jgi:pyruvate,orthophosphate dikinase
MGVATEDAAAQIGALVDEGLAEPFSDAFRLSNAGRGAANVLLAEDRAAWGPATADSALDAFVTLDRRMKQVVTDWQTKGPGVFNDHTDTAYDAAVIARLGELHRDVECWLTSASAGLPRLALYGVRLSAAAAQVASGNGKYIANPRVDSYHGAWFELHEDLIGLGGRTRAEETAAGRA